MNLLFWQSHRIHRTMKDVGFVNIVRNSVREATSQCRLPFTMLRRI